MRRLTSCVFLAFSAGLLAAPTALAGPLVDRAVEALSSDPVYVDPDAERKISEAEADALRERIDAADAGPIYVAVLPEAAAREAGGDASGVLLAIRRAVGQPGTYAAVVGNEFRAGSDLLRRGEARELADDAVRKHRAEGSAALLTAFVEGVGAARAGGGAGESGEGSDGGSAWPILVPLLAVGGIGFFLFRRRRRRSESDADFAEVKAAAQEDLLALAEDVRALDLDVEMPSASPEARADYERALTMYEKADRVLDRARRPEDLEEVSAAVEEGRFAMASAKARLEGRALPERRPPCFFDPRHGPSDRDVEWTPPWGAPRLVPACEADAQMVERGLEPAAREVTVGGRRTPYWDAPPAYGPWAGGFYGGFGGLFPGLLLGSMLSGAFAPPVMADEGGGDFGDGDFGGGDFGGGDFGGGDFGGGDF